MGRSSREPGSVVVAGVSTVTAAAYATLAMAVAVSIQDGFGSVALLVGSESRIVGGLLLVPLGVGLGVLTAVGLEGLVKSSYLSDPLIAALLGGGVSIGSWLLGIVVLLPLWLGLLGAPVSVPLVHWGGLVVCSVFGCVFGWMYGVLKGMLSFVEGSRLLVDSID